MTDESCPNLETLSELELTALIRERPWRPFGEAATVEIWHRHGRMIERYVAQLTRSRTPYWVNQNEFRDDLNSAIKVKLLSPSGRVKETEQEDRAEPEEGIELEGSEPKPADVLVAQEVPEPRVLSTYDGRGSFAGFLKRICAHEAINLARSFGTRSDKTVVAPPDANLRSDDERGELPEPVHRDGQARVALMVRSVLGELVSSGKVTARHQRVLWLRLWNGCRWAEIATEMGTSERTVERDFQDALSLVRLELERSGLTGLDDAKILEERYD